MNLTACRVAFAALLVAICCGCPANPPARKGAPPPLPAIDCAALWSLKNTAVGQLENGQTSAAATAFLEIAKAMPQDPLGTRNLVVARLQELKTGQATLASVEAAVADMLAREPESAGAVWLAARVTLTAAEQAPEGPPREALRAKATAQFEQALKLGPSDAAVHYELFDALRYSPVDVDLVRARAALQAAHKFAPDNLFVLVDWLTAQAETQDATIGDSLAKLAVLVAPLKDGIQRRSRVDVQQLLDAASKAVAAGQWPTVTARVRALGSVLRPEEISQSDRRRINPHPLEFLYHDFRAGTCLPGTNSVPSLQMPKLTRTEVDISQEGLGEPRAMTTVDFNLDGRQDILILGTESLIVYQQTEAAGWEASLRLPLTGETWGLTAVDLDRDASDAGGPPPAAICQDADPDVLVFGSGGLLVLKNELNTDGTRSLVNMLADQPLGDVRDVLTAIPADFDHDGDLDIVLSTPSGVQLWAQQGTWQFLDVSSQSQLPSYGLPFTTIIAVDIDRDIDLDLVLHGRNRPIGYLENLRHGELRYRPCVEGGAPSAAQSLAIIEADGNVSWDFVGSDLQLLTTDTPDRGKLVVRTGARIGTGSGYRLLVADLNNDSAMDVVTWTDRELKCLLGRGDASFSPVINLDLAGSQIHDVSRADIDSDGDLDLLATTPTGLVLYRNELATNAGWLAVRVRGAEDALSGRVNQYGVGSLVEVRTGDRYQAQVITGQVTHFGLGERTQADSMRVLWTNGVPQVVLAPQPNQTLCERLTLKGSCPYLYTWTGERFEFFTDLLWAAPLGLQFADGVLAPSRPWEYLLVPGETCQPREGQYVLQITEELWEAAYFDQVELIAIDHPAEVEVFSNEKVGPAEMAELKVHTVQQRRSPIAASDQRGRDVLDRVRDIDGVFVKAFDRELRQGLTEPHYLELDLGPLKDPQRIMLYLTGWIYPTDVSLNIAIDHDPELTGPQPPSLWTPDASGEFREVRPFLGFPGGKTKTIVVDVTDAFTPGDYRLRIPTTHEIYWDAAFFTVDDPAAEFRMTPLEMVSADVHPRGFSQPNLPQPNAPETYDYSQVSTNPKWPPMAGRFTRYGDVRELLTATDDRMLVMASGDELTVSFAPPTEPLPAGWKRDFFLHNVGWDKDADLHTVYGQTVEPMPSVTMPSYPYPVDTGPQDTPAYRNYLRIYQTREQQHGAFWRRPQ